MPPINEDAVVLRTVDFSETSMIVTFFTRNSGKIACIAKGARRLKNPFDSALDPMNQCKILVYPKSGDTLDLVTEAKLDERFRVRTLVSMYAGFHVVGFLDAFLEKGDAMPELFDLTHRTLADLINADDRVPASAKLKSPPEEVSRILLRFEFLAMDLLGFAPMLTRCMECEMEIDEKSQTKTRGRVAFAMLDGGVLCETCRPGHRQVASLSLPVIKIMRQLASENDLLWRRLKIDPKILGELRGVWNQYLANRLERPLTTLAWLKR